MGLADTAGCVKPLVDVLHVYGLCVIHCATGRLISKTPMLFALNSSAHICELT